MGPANCAVIGCSNSTQKLKKWKEDHAELCAEMICCCDPPFRLFMFPSIKRNSEKRKQWVKLMERQRADKKTWKPRGSDRVCSKHFVDEEPSIKNPDPTLDLGYQDTATRQQLRRTIVKHPLKEATSKRKIEFQPSDTATPKQTTADSLFISPQVSPKTPVFDIQSPVLSEHDYSKLLTTPTCTSCHVKGALIKNYVTKVRKLNQQVKKLKSTVNKLTKRREDRHPFSAKHIKTDAKMNFYTGISSILKFEAIYEMLRSYMPSMNYWRRAKKTTLSKVGPQRKSSLSQRKLSSKDALLLTLMRLRLGLLNEDLADRFMISNSNCSNTFKT